MDRVETLIRDTLYDQVRYSPIGPVPLDEHRSGGRRTTVTIVAASVLVLLVAGFLAFLQTSDRHEQSLHKLPRPVTLPAGLRIASYGPVSLQVPARLPTRQQLCGGPVANEVVAQNGLNPLCPVITDRLARNPGTVVWFSARNTASPYRAIPTSAAVVDGHRARRGYATGIAHLGHGVSGVVNLTAQQIAVGVTAPTRASVNRILNTLRVAPIDPFGCSAKNGSARTTPPGPSDVLVRTGAVSVVRCEYGNGIVDRTLIGSFQLGRAVTTRVVNALDELVPDPCRCVHGGTAARGDNYYLYFQYADGSALRVRGAIGDNLDTYDNGTRTVANYSDSVTQLLIRLTHERFH